MSGKPFSLENFYILLLVATSFSLNFAEEEKRIIEFPQLSDRVSKNDILVIDVRDSAEFKQNEKIPHSVNVPVGEICPAFDLPEDEFHSKYGIAKPGLESEFVLMCKLGKGAAEAYDKLEKKGFKNMLWYSGSLVDWMKHGGPVEK